MSRHDDIVAGNPLGCIPLKMPAVSLSTDTQGACPQAGIDIEPSSEAEPVSNVTLRGISCRNNTVRPPRLPPPSGLHSSKSGSEPSLRTGHAASAAARPIPAPARRPPCGVGAGRRASVRSELVGARGRLQRQRDRPEHGPSQEHREPNRLHGLGRATSFKRKRPKRKRPRAERRMVWCRAP